MGLAEAEAAVFSPCGVKHFHPIIAARIPEGSAVVDVGFERAALGALIRCYCRPKRLVGIEVWEPYIIHAEWHHIYDEILRLDLAQSPLPFKDREFDVAVCTEVIEHLEKPAGYKLIAELKRIAGKVMLTTPNGFHRQHFPDTPLQEHKSGWKVGELRRLNFKVRGVGALRIHGRYIRRPVDFSFILTSLTWVLPGLSDQLFAIWSRG